MTKKALMEQLAERRELIDQAGSMGAPAGDLDGNQLQALDRADKIAIDMAGTKPRVKEDVLALARLVQDLAGTPIIRLAARQVVTGIETIWR